MATLRQLEYLVAVADLGSFTRAASELHVSQPALSHQIAVLERDVGGPLLDRMPRAARLTPAGRVVLPHARTAVAEARRARTAARLATGVEAGELDVAAVYSATLGLLPGPLRRWRQAHPGVSLRLHEFRHGEAMATGMRAGVADVAIGPTPGSWSGRVEGLGDEELVIVVSKDDLLAGWQGPVDLAVLADRTWVHYVPGHGLAEILDQACAKAGFSPDVALRTEQTATAPLLAAAGLGPTLVPASLIPLGFDGLILATSPPTRRPFAIYYRPDTDPLTAAFARFMASQIVLMPDHVAKRLEPM